MKIKVQKVISFMLMLFIVLGFMPCQTFGAEDLSWLKYDRAFGFYEGLARVSINNKYGFIDTKGNQVIPIKYDKALWFQDGLANVQLDGKWGYIDKTGKEVIPLKYDGYWSNFYKELAAVSFNGKWGYIDKTGKEIIPFKYDSAADFQYEFATVFLDDKAGFIDTAGKEVFPSKNYSHIGNFSEGLADVVDRADWKIGFIDKTGSEVISPKYDRVWSFNDGLAKVALNKKIGFIDKTGKEIIPVKYDEASSFFNDIAMVEMNGIKIFIDKSGNEVTKPKYDYISEFSNGLAQVIASDKYGLIDKDGNEIVHPKYDYISGFSEGLAQVVIDNKYGFIDTTGNEVISLKYDSANNFSEGLASISLNGKYGFIDKTDDVVIPLKYDSCGDFYNGVAFVGICENPDGVGINGINMKYGLINKAGKGLNQQNVEVSSKINATPTNSKVLINDVEIVFNAYTIDGSNYFKLRDLAFAVNKTNKQFNIGYDENTKSVTMISEQGYVIQGNELAKGDGESKTYTKSANTFFLNGVKVEINSYMINGSNFVKLRDIMKLFNIGVEYNSETKTISIDTNLDYKD